jgi:predicted DNA-binding transcriptional regulator YafY
MRANSDGRRTSAAPDCGGANLVRSKSSAMIGWRYSELISCWPASVGDYHLIPMNRVERLTAILLLLQDAKRPRTSEEIALHFEVSKRTIIRDVQALSEMGVPIIAREGAGGGYSLPGDYRLPPLPLTSREAFLLLLALSSINKLSDAPFAQERASLMGKLRAVLPAHQHDDVERLLSAVSVDVPEREQRAPFLDVLLQAAQRKQWVQIEYQSAGRRSMQRVFPRRIFTENGLWYLDAYSHEHEEDRRYRADRIQHVALVEGGLNFAPPDPISYNDESHPQVVVELTSYGVALLDTEPHLAGQTVRREDGSGQLCFRCPPSELAYYARYFAGLGGQAIVHEPAELRQQIYDLGEWLANQHGTQ